MDYYCKLFKELRPQFIQVDRMSWRDLPKAFYQIGFASGVDMDIAICMKKPISLFTILFLLSATLFSCIKEEQSHGEKDTMRSSDRMGTSHNTGKNCISCHKYYVGGSVFQKDLSSVYAGAVVQLSSQASGAGTIVARITTDKNGNIYTSNTVKFGTGLYVSVTGNSVTKYMTAAITSGGCNGCHGSTTSRVWVE